MTIALIDYDSGNVHSAQKALEAVSGNNVTLTDDPKIITEASHIILPGVGSFGDCINSLNAKSGVLDAMEQAVLERRTPFLGICVGMQLLAKTGYEHGTHTGLGWLDTEVKPIDTNQKIPHMGWNNLSCKRHALFKKITPESDVYFVHSYAMTDSEYTIATTQYDDTIVAAVAKDNIMGVQFHPEKSQHVGLQLLRNFLS